jgi:hypothetical protein
MHMWVEDIRYSTKMSNRPRPWCRRIIHLEAEGVLRCCDIVSIALVTSLLISDLLALARLALPVGCGVSFLAACTPNLIGGAGPVLCGTNGCAVGIDGIGGMGGIGGGFCPNPVGWG